MPPKTQSDLELISEIMQTLRSGLVDILAYKGLILPNKKTKYTTSDKQEYKTNQTNKKTKLIRQTRKQNIHQTNKKTKHSQDKQENGTLIRQKRK